MGGVLRVPRGTRVELAIDLSPATTPNWAQFVPSLARVDVIAGTVTGAVTDPDTFTAPTARVVKSFDIDRGARRVSLRYDLGRLDVPYYVRIRGTDGLQTAPGLLGPQVDPVGPAMAVDGDSDPWSDLWFYANPTWVVPA